MCILNWKKNDAPIIQSLGRRRDGIVFPITLYVLSQIVSGKKYTILALHDATKKLGSEYSLKRKNKELEMINQVGKAVNSSLSLGEVLNTILEESKNIYNTRFSAIWLYEEKGLDFVCVNANGTNAVVKIGMHHDKNFGIFKKLLEERTPIFIDDVSKKEINIFAKDIDHGFTPHSMLALPIFVSRTINRCNAIFG